MSFKLKGLREKRAAVRAKIEALGTKIRTENRAMEADEQAAFDALKTEWVALGDQVKKTEDAMKAMDDVLAADAGGDAADPNADPAADPAAATQNSGVGRGKNKPAKRNGDGDDPQHRDANRKLRRIAFVAWARAQHGRGLKPEHRKACEALKLNPRAKFFEFRIGGPDSLLKKRALSASTAAAGAYTIAPDFSYALESALLDFSNVRGVCDEFTTSTGVDMPYPTEDDTSNEGEQLGENTETAFADVVFSSVTFKGYKYSSKGILVPQELLEDSEFVGDEFLGQKIGERIGRITGRRYTTGTGTGQPQGIVTASTLGVTAASATAFTADELTRLAFSIDRAYRSGSKVGYMMSDSAMAYALLLKDSYGRPLLRDSYRDGIMIPTINGFPVWTNQYMAACSGTGGVPVTGSKHVLFGDMSKFKIRDVGVVRVRKLEERYAEKDQVGFVGFMRTDSRCINSAAIKHLLQA